MPLIQFKDKLGAECVVQSEHILALVSPGLLAPQNAAPCVFIQGAQIFLTQSTYRAIRDELVKIAGPLNILET